MNKESKNIDMSPGPANGLIDCYRELLDLQDDVAASEMTRLTGLDKAQLQERLAAGTPLLAFDDFFPEWERIKPVFQRVLEWAARANPEHKWTDADMGAALFRKLALDWYSGTSPDLKLEVPAELIAVVGASIKPFLQAYSRLLMPVVEQPRWRRRYCPVCGGSPDFSFLDKEQGSRWLVCSRCDGAWLFQRLECPFCGTQDQAKLAYLPDNTGRYRLYTCDACRTYIKTIDLRQAQQNVRLPLERVQTLDLDRRASEDGYVPASLHT